MDFTDFVNNNLTYAASKVIYYDNNINADCLRLAWMSNNYEKVRQIDGYKFEQYISFAGYTDHNSNSNKSYITFRNLMDVYNIDIIFGYYDNNVSNGNSSLVLGDNEGNSFQISQDDGNNCGGITKTTIFNGRTYNLFPTPIIIGVGNFDNHFRFAENCNSSSVLFLVAELSSKGIDKVDVLNESRRSFRLKEWLCNDPPIAVDYIDGSQYFNHPRLLHDEVVSAFISEQDQ